MHRATCPLKLCQSLSSDFPFGASCGFWGFRAFRIFKEIQVRDVRLRVYWVPAAEAVIGAGG